MECACSCDGSVIKGRRSKVEGRRSKVEGRRSKEVEGWESMVYWFIYLANGVLWAVLGWGKEGVEMNGL